jgi:hypothetical protein
MPAWVMRGCPQRLPTGTMNADGEASREDFVGDEIVRQDYLRRLQQAKSAQRQQLRVARAGAREVDHAWLSGCAHGLRSVAASVEGRGLVRA